MGPPQSKNLKSTQRQNRTLTTSLRRLSPAPADKWVYSSECQYIPYPGATRQLMVVHALDRASELPFQTPRGELGDEEGPAHSPQPDLNSKRKTSSGMTSSAPSVTFRSLGTKGDAHLLITQHLHRRDPFIYPNRTQNNIRLKPPRTERFETA